MPLHTIVEIDTLLFYEENFRKSELKLIPSLLEFHQVTQYGRNDFEDLQNIETHAKESVISFSKFVRSKAKQLHIQMEGHRHNKLLIKFGLSVTKPFRG